MTGRTVSIALVATALALACSDSPTAPPGLRSPDGVMLVVRREAGRLSIYAVLPDGSRELRLTNGNADDTDPRWSPDGRQILFVSNRDSANGMPRAEIWIMAPDGSRQRRLFAGASAAESPRWSPDGRRIVLEQHQWTVEPYFRLYVMNADGSGVRPLAGDGGNDRSPEWSPDGQHILFYSSSLLVMNADGSGAQRLSNASLCAGQIGGARWSPDGSRIVYTCATTSGSSISVMNADGSAPVAITPPGSFGYDPDDGGPVWSRDGSRIAFTSPREVYRYQVWVVSASGGTPTQVTSGTADTFVADWGPPWR